MTAPALPSLKAESSRALVALNNMGVAMSYRQAQETFKNAIAIGKLCRVPEPKAYCTLGASLAAHSLICKKLQEANGFAAKPVAVEQSNRIEAHVVSLDAALYNMISVKGKRPVGNFSSLQARGYRIPWFESKPQRSQTTLTPLTVK